MEHSPHGFKILIFIRPVAPSKDTVFDLREEYKAGGDKNSVTVWRCRLK